MIRGTGIHTFHITSICARVNMPTTMHIYFPLHLYCSLCRPYITVPIHQNQWSATFIYCATAKYVPATNMPLKCHRYVICQNCLTCINGGSMPIYIPHMNSVELTMRPGTQKTMITLMTQDNDDDDDDDATAQIPILNWPLWPNQSINKMQLWFLYHAIAICVIMCQ